MNVVHPNPQQIDPALGSQGAAEIQRVHFFIHPAFATDKDLDTSDPDFGETPQNMDRARALWERWDEYLRSLSPQDLAVCILHTDGLAELLRDAREGKQLLVFTEDGLEKIEEIGLYEFLQKYCEGNGLSLAPRSELQTAGYGQTLTVCVERWSRRMRNNMDLELPTDILTDLTNDKSFTDEQVAAMNKNWDTRGIQYRRR